MDTMLSRLPGSKQRQNRSAGTKPLSAWLLRRWTRKIGAWYGLWHTQQPLGSVAPAWSKIAREILSLNDPRIVKRRYKDALVRLYYQL